MKEKEKLTILAAVLALVVMIAAFTWAVNADGWQGWFAWACVVSAWTICMRCVGHAVAYLHNWWDRR